jgi:ABC-type bacteriocin/lantibiotic exporter with double-glycine peptidase domain
VLRTLTITLVALGLTGCLPYTGGARPVSPSDVPTSYVRAAPTPVVRQHQEADCGLAALAMIAGAWGQSWSVDELNALLPPDTKGVKLGAIRDLARSRGLDAYAIQGTPADLAHELGAGRPVILGLALPFATNKRLGHFEVAIAIDPRDGTLITLDPASGRTMRRTRTVLEQEWGPSKHATLVVVGRLAPALARTMLSTSQ